MRIGCYDTHPACDLFPLMSEHDLAALADDIGRNGLHAPIIVHEGRILDGRNRLLACLKAGAAPRFDHWRGTGSPLRWLVSMNLHRRHLDTSQRAMIAARALRMFEIEARARQGSRSDLRATLREGECGKASEKAAAVLHVGPRTVEDAKAVLRYGGAELVDEVDRGKLTVSAAARIARRRRNGTAGGGHARGRAAPPEDMARRSVYGFRGRPPGRTFEVVAAFLACDDEYERCRSLDVRTFAARDCVTFVATPDPLLPRALELLSRWGFAYASTVVISDRRVGKKGRFTTQKHDFVVVGSRGSHPPMPEDECRPDSILDIDVLDANAKHDAVLDLIDAMFPAAHKVEVFATSGRPGWSVEPGACHCTGRAPPQDLPRTA